MFDPTEDPTTHLGFQQLRQMIGEPLPAPSSLNTDSVRPNVEGIDTEGRGEADDKEEEEDNAPVLPPSALRKKKLTSKVGDHFDHVEKISAHR